MTRFVHQLWRHRVNCGVIFYCATKTASIVSVIVSGFKDVGFRECRRFFVGYVRFERKTVLAPY